MQKFSDVKRGQNGNRDNGQEGWNNSAVMQQHEIKIRVHDSSLDIYFLGDVRSIASPSLISGMAFCVVNVTGADRGDNKATIVCTTSRSPVGHESTSNQCFVAGYM